MLLPEKEIPIGLSPEILHEMDLTYLGPDRLKADLATPFEKALMLTVCWSGLALFVPIGILFESHGKDWKLSAIVALIALPVLILSAIILKRTDNFFVIDLRNRVILYHFQFFSITRETLRVNFEGLAAVTVNGVVPFGEEGDWSYQVELCSRDGNQFPICNDQEDLEAMNRKGKVFASLLGCPFVPGGEKIYARLALNPASGKMEVVLYRPGYFERHWFYFMVIFGPVVLILLFFLFKK